MAAKWQQWMPLDINKIRGSMFFKALPDAGKVGYLYLLMAQWETEDGALPSDPDQLAELSGLGDRWEELSARLLRKFQPIEGGKIRNLVNYNEWIKARKVFEARSESAQKTNNKRQNTPNKTVTDTVTVPVTATVTDTVTATHRQGQEQEQKAIGLKPSVRPEEYANVWNRNRGPLPKVERFTESRRKKVQARMREGITLERFTKAVECCRGKPFLRGDNDRGWIATFDWLVENDRNVEKAITNPYGGADGERGKDKGGLESSGDFSGLQTGHAYFDGLLKPIGGV